MIAQLKWASVAITITAAVCISFKVLPVWMCYCIFLLGHLIMLYVMYRTRDWSLLFMNLVWVMIDIVGFINWF